MNPHESYFGHFTALRNEARDAVGGAGRVDEPREWRFDVEFEGRRYAVQAYPNPQRVFVGQYLGDHGVVWFDELRYDELHHGWRSGERPAFDLFQGLAAKPSLAHEDIEAAAARPQSAAKASPTSVEAREREQARGHERLRARPEGARWWRVLKLAYRSYRAARAHMPHPLQQARQAAGRVLRR